MAAEAVEAVKEDFAEALEEVDLAETVEAPVDLVTVEVEEVAPDSITDMKLDIIMSM